MPDDRPQDNKAMTLRLPRDQAEELELVAQAEGVPVAEVVREAIAKHVAAKLSDRRFQARLRAQIERNRRILARLSQGKGAR